jgi:dipeptidyl aminopeptidase/acylaminoacyl peptidase
MRTKSAFFLLLALAILVIPAGAQQNAKKPLDHSIYDSWRSISGTSFSRDGAWILYRIAPAVGDAEMTVRNTGSGVEHKIPRGALGARFTNDGKFVVATVVPSKAEVDQAKKEKKAPKDMPKNALAILSLDSGKVAMIEKVRSWRLADKGSDWIGYFVDEAAPAAPGGARPSGGGQPGTAPATTPPAAAQTPATGKPQEPAKPQKKRDHAAGSELVVRSLATGEEKKIADVADYAFSEDGKTLVYAVSTKTGEGDGLFSLNLAEGKTVEVMKGMGRYQQIVLHKNGQVAFLSDRDDYAKDPAPVRLYFAEPGKPAKEVAAESSAGIPANSRIARTGIRFSEDGKRLLFSTQNKPEPEPKNAPVVPDDEKVEVDIWHWQDPVIQPQQLLQAAAERNRSYEAVLLLSSGKIVQLESPEMPNVTIADRGNANVAIAQTNVPYRVESTWAPGISDIYLVDVPSGTKKRLFERYEGNALLSPKGQYALTFDPKTREWKSYDTRTGATVRVGGDIPYPLHNELADTPDDAGPYGLGGWLEGERGVLILDRYDIWLCDPSGKAKSVCITDGYGRMRQITFRPMAVEREQTHWKPDATLLLNARSNETQGTGFYRDRIGADAAPQMLIFGDKLYSYSGKAEDADKVAITRQDFTEYPNLWLTNLSFENPVKITDANPEQSQYVWGTSELVTWTSLHGDKLQGVLVKPENFDPSKKYPMIVYFYERLAQNLHQFRSPTPSASTINPTMFASNGYLVFMPDIVYREGYPGASAEACILPGVTSLVARGYVDEKRIGLQGQSWGGYQVAHLITRSNMFAAACAGAPVTNMFSAYGGIRWGSGLLRQMQYEQGQSRIGGSIWERPLLYLENSPLFWAEQVNTPLLMMNNDKDGAVPWYQGIEFYSALRRLQKPVWLVVYNGEDHNLTQMKNRKDWSIRLHQFFDHYLKDAPAPVWLAEGIPAVKKGKTMGLDLVPKSSNGKG